MAARIKNISFNQGEWKRVLEPFYGMDGQWIPGFPKTLAHAKRLNCKCLSLSEWGSGLNHMI